MSNAAAQEPPLNERVYSTVRDLIVTGRLRPGEAVTELGISRDLDVSRTPVREAVKRLLAENLLQVTRRGSLCVYAPTIQDVAEIYHARGLLEGAAAGLAAIAKTDKLIADLEGILSQTQTCVDEGWVSEGAQLNTRFHETILNASQDGRISSLIAGLNPAIVRYRRLSLTFPEHLRRSHQEHQEIVRLFRDGSPAQVEAHVRGHILRAGARVVVAVHQMEGGDLPRDLPVLRLLLEEYASPKGE